MVTAENCRRAPQFRKFAEHRGAQGSGCLAETRQSGVRRYHVA